MTDMDVAALIAHNAHISDETIAKDIRDTEDEIRILETALRFARFQVEAHEHGIADRRDFIAKLRAIQEARRR